jgi:hypothetical protein
VVSTRRTQGPGLRASAARPAPQIGAGPRARGYASPWSAEVSLSHRIAAVAGQGIRRRCSTEARKCAAASTPARAARKEARFQVAAAYVLYCGDVAYRASVECDRNHDGRPCRERDRAGVSSVAALVVENVVTLYGKGAGVAAFHDAVPVEDIASPAGQDTPIVPLTHAVAEDLGPVPAPAAARRSPRGKGAAASC